MNPFKRPNDRYGSSAPVESPYLRASREWDMRIGSAVVQAFPQSRRQKCR